MQTKTKKLIVVYGNKVFDKDLVSSDLPSNYIHSENPWPYETIEEEVSGLRRFIARNITKEVCRGWLIQTCSHVVLNELNNLILLSSLKDSEAKAELMSRYGITTDMLVNFNDMAAYAYDSEKCKYVQLEVTDDGVEWPLGKTLEDQYSIRVGAWNIYNQNVKKHE